MALVNTSLLQKAGINIPSGVDALKKQLNIGQERDPNIEDIDRPSGRSVRGLITTKGNSALEDVLFFQFNPDNIQDQKGTDWYVAKHLGFSGPQPFWISGSERTIVFDLFFDATAETNNKYMGVDAEGYDTIRTLQDNRPRGVLDEIEKLQSYQYPISESNQRFIGNVATPTPRFEAPPILVFCYGPFYMECALTKLDIEYTLFDRDLIPRRANANVTLTVYEADKITIDANITKMQKK